MRVHVVLKVPSEHAVLPHLLPPPSPPHTHIYSTPKHRDAFGRPLYKLLLGLSLLLAANFSLSSAYCLPLLQSSVEWKRQLGLVWQG